MNTISVRIEIHRGDTIDRYDDHVPEPTGTVLDAYLRGYLVSWCFFQRNEIPGIFEQIYMRPDRINLLNRGDDTFLAILEIVK